MFKNINNQIEEFTFTIKDKVGCQKMMDYMNSNIYSAIKLLMFSSKSFSIITRVLLFLIVFLTGVVILSAINALSINILYLILVDFILFVFSLFFVFKFKSILENAIKSRINSLNS